MIGKQMCIYNLKKKIKLLLEFGKKILSAFKGIQIKTLIRYNRLSMKLAKKNP